MLSDITSQEPIRWYWFVCFFQQEFGIFLEYFLFKHERTKQQGKMVIRMRKRQKNVQTDEGEKEKWKVKQ